MTARLHGVELKLPIDAIAPRRNRDTNLRYGMRQKCARKSNAAAKAA
jgi:hypothetical protein